MQRTVTANGIKITYELERKRVKNINMRIKRDMTVTVSASRAVPVGYIDGFVVSRADFILKTLEKFQAAPVPRQRRYESGETYNILGSRKRLAVIHGDKNRAEIFGDVIILTVIENNIEIKQRLFEALLRREFTDGVTRICRDIYPAFERRGVPFPTIRVRRMKSRWGSCIPPKQSVTFNLALAEVPIRCVEYVVAHELTHFLHPDHSRRFYDSLEKIMPDWKSRKTELDKYIL
ncbi:MAG: M48 family metallopeptidase [Eubacterium sp.]|nr:M48 family metallopeptidase [Eubacterium sp.]